MITIDTVVAFIGVAAVLFAIGSGWMWLKAAIKNNHESTILQARTNHGTLMAMIESCHSETLAKINADKTEYLNALSSAKSVAVSHHDICEKNTSSLQQIIRGDDKLTFLIESMNNNQSIMKDVTIEIKEVMKNISTVLRSNVQQSLDVSNLMREFVTVEKIRKNING